MAEQKEFDLVIIGSGPAGYTCAVRASQLGLETALVEKNPTLGGTCLNIGCIPSKALLDSSELFFRASHEANVHGISLGKPKLDLAVMHARKQGVVDKLTGGLRGLMKANGVTVFAGTGSLAAAGEVLVTGENGEVRIRAHSIVLATGSVPTELPSAPLDGDRVVDSTGALAFPEVPKRLGVIGGGAIGLELGSVWSRLGSEVSVIEIMPEILSGWDRQVQQTMRRELEKQGISFRRNTACEGLNVQKTGVKLSLRPEDGEPEQLGVDRVLVAAGRRPYTEGLGLDAVGIQMDGRRIRVDRHFATNVPGIYAIGDIVSGPMLAHKAEEDAVAVAEIIAGKPGHVEYSLVPNVVYTWPEAACVGRTEEQLKADGVPYRKGSFPFAANGRGLAMEATSGFVKILAHQETDRILGAHIVGPWASDLISEIVTAMHFAASSEDIARIVHAHPTLPEAVREAALAVDNRALNIANRRG